MPPEVARTEVFRRHTLAGFVPSVPHIRYPVTIGMYEEEQNLGLFLAPIDLRLARILTGIPDTEQALVLRGPAVMDDAYLTAEPSPDWVDWAALDHVVGDVDVVHFPRRTSGLDADLDIRTPILAAPGQAVPTEHGSRVAIGFADGCHAAIISPDRALIRRTLTGFIAAYAAEAAQAEVPAPPEGLVNTLMQPGKPGEWYELRWLTRRRYSALEVAPLGDVNRASRWVSRGLGHSWRPGWSW